MRNILSATLSQLFFLLFCWTAVCRAGGKHDCLFDKMVEDAGFRPKAIVRELPRKGRTGVKLMTASSKTEWAPIRFGIFSEDLNNKLKYCTAEGDVRPTFNGKTSVCDRQDVLSERKKEILLRETIPQATALHTERLLVQPVAGRILVPNYTDGVCSEFTVPSAHHTDGVEGADVILYVAAGLGAHGGIGWAIYCSQHQRTTRPLIGVVHFNPKFITSDEHFVRTAAHEIAHVLGFEFEFLSKKGMVKKIAGVRGKKNVVVINTLNVVNKTRKHYNCLTASGMELEDEGGDGTMGSHWEMRNAKDEMMAGITGFGYYTTLTMALFEDMGFYRANWSMAETMNWGKNAGCGLLEEKCLTDGKTEYPNMFCTERGVFQNEYSCTSDRFALGHCSNTIRDSPLPKNLQYFSNSRLGSDVGLTDYCPYISPGRNTWCASGAHLLGSRIGPKSKCLKGEGLTYRNTRIGDVCAQVKCTNGIVRVRYIDNNTWHDCSPGEKITPGGLFSSGHIVCPNYHEVCMEIGADKSPVDTSPMRLDVVQKEDSSDMYTPVRLNADRLHGKGRGVGVEAEDAETTSSLRDTASTDFGVTGAVACFQPSLFFLTALIFTTAF